MIKIYIIAIFIITLNSCSTYKYIIGVDTNQHIQTKPITKTIGVSQIDIPEYLLSGKIAILKGNKIEYRDDGLWVDEINKRLQREIIRYIQERLPKSNIVEYPWSVSKLPDINIKIIITKFISDGDKVELKSTYKIYNKRFDKRELHQFKVVIKHKNSNEEIVKAMSLAFDKLSKSIYNKLY